MSTAELAVKETIIVPACEGRGVRLAAGTHFRCVDLEGSQCGDLFAFVDGDLGEYHSAEHTRVRVARLFPRVGEQFVTNRRRAILTFVDDSSPGHHDMLIASCDPTRYAELGVEGWHASCQESLEKVMEGLGFPDHEMPAPINIFTNLPVDAGLAFAWDPATSSAGDSVTFRAELDCYVVLTACPQDITPINGHNPTSLALEILG